MAFRSGRRDPRRADTPFSRNPTADLPAQLCPPKGSATGGPCRRESAFHRQWRDLPSSRVPQAAYYRTQVSAEVFGGVDHYLWRLTYKWARFSHQNKPKRWVVHQYYGPFNKARQDRWVFGDRKSGAYLHKFSWTRILRHRIVRHGASPDDPALADYWAWRQRKVPLRSTRPPKSS
jgi:hypothetical protein